jgi:hypothetical protein
MKQKKSMTPRIDKVDGIRDIPSENRHYYVVLRDSRRVSDQNHLTVVEAESEKRYWDTILSKWPDGTKTEVYTAENVNYKN